MLKRWMYALAPALAICATLAVSTGTASAKTNVLTAIAQQNHSIEFSRSLTRVERLERTDARANVSKADKVKLADALDTLGRKFLHAATVVSHSSADSSRQAAGRKDWVTAVRDVGGALLKLGHAFHLLANGNTTQAGPLILKAEKAAERGLTLGRKAGRLLDSSAGF